MLPHHPNGPVDPDELRGWVLRHDAEIKRLHERDGEIARLVGNVRSDIVTALRKLEEKIDQVSDWRETTEVRNLRRAELAELRDRASKTDHAELAASKARRNTKLLAGAGAALLYALAELIKSLIH